MDNETEILLHIDTEKKHVIVLLDRRRIKNC